MSFFTRSSSPAPRDSYHAYSQPSSPTQQLVTFDDANDFLSSDIDLSFSASNMSINSAPSSPSAMDISPAPPLSKRDSAIMRERNPGANIFGVSRVFGRELSNNTPAHPPSPSPPRSNKLLPPAPRPDLERSGGSSRSSARQRSALPSHWLQQPQEPTEPAKTSVRDKRSGAVFNSKPLDLPTSPEPAHRQDAMDIDMASPAPFFESSPDGPNALSPLPKSNDFSALFFSPGSPTVQPVPAITSKKRRSCEPEEEELQRVPPPPLASQPQFSSSPPSSPSVNRPNSRTFERSVTTVGQGTLFKPLLKLQQVLPKRTLQARRPTLSVQPTSANPILNGPATAGIVPPVRRAFSAHVQPSDQMAIGGDEVDGDEVDGDETEPEDDSFQGRPLSAHPNIRRKPNFVDGTLVGKSPASSGKKPRLPGFGDNEADGKILPCKKVREDGLMRINCETLEGLLDGEYASQIAGYRIIDCRFDYEYEGGHIPGAINLNTTAAIDEFLLAADKPEPSRSGDGVGKKTILIFHCEFSVKRAPTFAKHLRSKDRAVNQHVYPKIHYPEVYILEGGYCQYFKECPDRCELNAYTRMDDPDHLRARRSDLNNFRRWDRTRSYTYGERPNIEDAASPSNNRPVSTGTTLNMAGGAKQRALPLKGKLGLSTLQEDADSSCAGSESSHDGIGDSPCPPSAALFRAGTIRPRALGRTASAAIPNRR